MMQAIRCCRRGYLDQKRTWMGYRRDLLVLNSAASSREMNEDVDMG